MKLHGLDTVKAELEADAEASKRTLLRQIAHETNFQNFDRCKTAFGKAYGLKFGEISEAQPVIDPLRKFIRHRHRIVHVSPLLGTLATPGDAEGTNEPVFSNEATGKAAKDTFGRFIAALHAATLKLRPFS